MRTTVPTILVLLTIVVTTIAVATIAVTPALGQSPAATLFEKGCYSCHNIGGGDKQGPDLRGVSSRRSKEWIHKFIVSPSALNRSGDATAADLFRRFAPVVMPDQALSPEQIDGLLAMIDELTAKNGTFTPAGAKLSRPITKEDIPKGLKLFTGEVRLHNGGPACIGCHSVEGVGAFGGGTLGPDLSQVNIRYRDPELIGILQNPAFPTMQSQFAAHPLTPEEIARLFALFRDQAALAIHAPPDLGKGGGLRTESRFIIVGGSLLVLSMGAMNFFWRKRLKGVREEIVRRKTGTTNAARRAS
jgi:mono/diheme cytochrome c family protein